MDYIIVLANHPIPVLDHGPVHIDTGIKWTILVFNNFLVAEMMIR
jgi:hypothetical protein